MSERPSPPSCCPAPGPHLADPDWALQCVLDHAGPPLDETLPAVDALGRVLREDVVSGQDLPPFDNAAMDGFALRLEGRPAAAGSRFAVAGAQFAGDPVLPHTGPAIEITTGARVPEGYDSVVMVEHTRIEEGGTLVLEHAATPGQNIRRHGEDIAAGDRVLRAGRVLDPAAIGVLAALGVAQVRVASRPKIAIVCTGRELVDDPGRPLRPGQIRNSNLPTLRAQAIAAGAEVVHAETVGDEVEPFLAALHRAREAGATILVSTGAVSMGRHDFVPQALARLGARALFHKVRIRPGKPLLFAPLDEGTCLFGLPGNPVSSLVGFRFFVEPLLRRRLGLADEPPLRLPLAHEARLKQGFRHHLKARIHLCAQGRLEVEVLPGQESFRLAPLLAANAWIVVDPPDRALDAGTLVDVHGPSHLHTAIPHP